jgi:hypothetical protein
MEFSNGQGRTERSRRTQNRADQRASNTHGKNSAQPVGQSGRHKPRRVVGEDRARSAPSIAQHSGSRITGKIISQLLAGLSSQRQLLEQQITLIDAQSVELQALLDQLSTQSDDDV